MKEGKNMNAYDEYKRSFFVDSLVYQCLYRINEVGFEKKSQEVNIYSIFSRNYKNLLL